MKEVFATTQSDWWDDLPKDPIKPIDDESKHTPRQISQK